MSFDCKKCPGYCCTYGATEVTDTDIKRLAKHFGLNFRRAKKKFTKKTGTPGDRYRDLKQKTEKIFGYSCMFFDQKKRRCSVYEARPNVCRRYPYGNKCGYYELLKFERDLQADPKLIVTAAIK